MAQKYYAVKNGRKTGIYRTWEECRENIDRFPGAQFKSFATQEEAELYIGKAVTDDIQISRDSQMLQDTQLPRKGSTLRNRQELPEAGTIVAYVDGSYNGSSKEFSYGLVILEGEEEIHFSKKLVDEELAKMHNVAGELAGAMAAMEYALIHDKKGVIIYHDYEGIAKWCLGEWKANKPGTIAYKEYYEKVSKKIRIEFIKVKGHSNDQYNDLADSLAKEALGIL